MSIVVLVLAALGLVASLYAFFVERKVRFDVSYKPMCDINNRISCTRAFTSPYGKLLGFSNTIIGILFYATVLVADFLGFEMLVFGLSFAACVGTILLAYLLYFRIKSFCLVCTSIYVINVLLLIFSYANI